MRDDTRRIYPERLSSSSFPQQFNSFVVVPVARLDGIRGCSSSKAEIERAWGPEMRGISSQGKHRKYPEQNINFTCKIPRLKSHQSIESSCMQTRKALAHIQCRPDQEQHKPIKFAHLANQTEHERLRNFLDIENAPKKRKRNQKKSIGGVSV